MTERAQALEAALEKARQGVIGFAAEIQDGRVPVVGAVRNHLVLNLALIAGFLTDALEAVQPPPPVSPAGASEPPHVVKLWASGGWHATACHDYLMSDGSIRTMKHEEAMALKPAPVSPVEPTPSINCPLCGEAVQQVSSATLSLALSQHVLWACRRAPNKVEPTPEPPTESVDEKASKWLKATMLSTKGRDEDTLPTAVDRAVRRVLGSCSGESLHRHLVRLVRELAPTGAPAPCVWRSYEVSAYPGCDPDNVSKNLDPDDVKLMRFCPYCGHPLTVER